MSRNSDIKRSMLVELLEGQPTKKKQKTSVTAPVSTLMLDGQRALEEKRFSDAIRHLSNAIDNSRDRKADLLHLYDLRSNAYIKRNNYDHALKDAKYMIRLDRSDPRGYLKCAQIEQTRGNPQEAIRVCEYGLKSLPQSDKGYARITACVIRVKETIKKNVVFDKATDPMAVLPPELLAMVISTFDYRQVIAIMRVCRSWRNRLKGTDIVMQTIDTRHSERILGYEQVKAAFSRLGKSPKQLALARLNDNAARFARNELARWIRWESLQILIIEDGKIQLSGLRYEKLSNLRHFQIGPGVLLSHELGTILKNCPKLHTVILRGTGNSLQDRGKVFLLEMTETHESLKNLTISPDSISPIRFTFPKNCALPNLEKLQLVNVNIDHELNLSAYSRLRDLTLRNASIDDRYNLRTPPTLERFTLSGPFANVFPRPEEIKMPAANLTTISVEGSDSIRFLAYAIRQGLDKMHLKHLSMADFVTYSNVGGRFFENDLNLLKTIPGNGALQNVEVLALKDDTISNHDFPAVSSLFPAVRHLELESPRITEEFVSDLVRIPDNKVQTVILRNCTSVSQSIVAWAKARKVDVRFTRQARSDTFGDRKVQYE